MAQYLPIFELPPACPNCPRLNRNAVVRPPLPPRWRCSVDPICSFSFSTRLLIICSLVAAICCALKSNVTALVTIITIIVTVDIIIIIRYIYIYHIVIHIIGAWACACKHSVVTLRLEGNPVSRATAVQASIKRALVAVAWITAPYIKALLLGSINTVVLTQ